MPTRFKIKESGLPDLKKSVEDKIKSELSRIQSINISLDGWSDAIKRSFNGFIAQGKLLNLICLLINNIIHNSGIDDNWCMKTITISFEYMSGEHSSVNIKKQYDRVVEKYEIKTKCLK